MEEIEKDSKGNDLRGTDSKQLYTVAKDWKSDLEFYWDDLRFLRHLIDKYFMAIAKSENLDLLKEIVLSLSRMDKKCNALLDKVNEHQLHLGRLIEDPDEKKLGGLMQVHKNLNDEITGFVRDFRRNRKEVFAITEYVMGAEELAIIFKT